MKRIFFALFSIFLLGVIVLGQGVKREEGKVLGVEVLSQEEIDLLCADKEFLRFDSEIFFNQCPIGYDESQNMLLIPQKLENNFFDGEIESSEGRLVFLFDELWFNKSTAMADNHVFRLFWISEEYYWMYNVYFSGMPIAKLSSEYIDENGENNGSMWIYDQYSSNMRFQNEKCRFRERGSSSLVFPKVSYKIVFTEGKHSLLRMREDDDWILNSLYDDEGLIHNKISYELWRQIAASNQIPNDEGITMEFVEIFVDNQYQGVYGLLERVDKKSLGLSEKDILYKGVDAKAVGEDDFYLELTDEMSPAFEIKYPQMFNVEHWEPLKEWYYNFYVDKTKGYDEISRVLNIDNAVDYLLFNIFISGDDNTQKNVYYWADYQADGTYKMIKVPWDLNMTWGNAWCESHQYHFNIYQKKTVESVWGWTEDMEYLYQINPTEIGNIMKQRWSELRKNVITRDNLYRMLDKEFDFIHSSGSYKRDCMYWGSREELWSDSFIYEYAEQKIIKMDEYINSL